MANDVEVQIGLEGGDELKRQLRDINTSLKEMKRSVDEVKDSFDGMVDGIDQLDSVLNTVTDNIEDAKKAMKEFTTDSGSAVAEATESTSSIGDMWNTFVTVYENMDKAVKNLKKVDDALNAMAETTQVAEAAQIALNTAQSLIPANFLIAGIAGVTVGLGLFLSSIADTENETMQLYASIDQASQGLGDFKASLDQSAKGREQRTEEIEAESAVIKNLADDVINLSEKENKSASEKEKLAHMVDLLNEKMPGLSLEYDKQADILNRSSAEISNYVSEYQKKLMLQAAEEDFAEVIKEQYEAQKKVNEAEKLYNDAVINAENAETQLRDAIEERNSSANSSIIQESIDNYTASLEMATQKEDEAKETLEGYQAELKNAEANVNAVSETVAGYVEELSAMEEATSDAEIAQISLGDTTFNVTEEVKQQFEALKAAYDEAYQSAETSIQGQLGLFNEMDTSSDLTMAQMIERLDQQGQAMINWGNNLQLAAAAGLDEGLLQQLAEAGPEAAGYLEVIANATDEEIEAMNREWRERFNASQYATEEMAQATTGADEEMKKLVQGTSTGVENTNKIWTDQFTAKMLATREMKGASYGVVQILSEMALEAQKKQKNFMDSGINSAVGYGDGFESQKDYVTGKVVGVASSALIAFNKRLGIESPSRVFMQSGKYSAEGFALGWKSRMGDVAQMMSESIPKFFDFDAVTSSLHGGISSAFNYRMLANTIVDAFVSANVGIYTDDREFGRLVRGVSG